MWKKGKNLDLWMTPACREIEGCTSRWALASLHACTCELRRTTCLHGVQSFGVYMYVYFIFCLLISYLCFCMWIHSVICDQKSYDREGSLCLSMFPVFYSCTQWVHQPHTCVFKHHMRHETVVTHNRPRLVCLLPWKMLTCPTGNILNWNRPVSLDTDGFWPVVVIGGLAI